MRIVLDTSALVSGLRSSAGAAGTVLQLVKLGDVTLCLDYKLSCEYREVATRGKHLSAGKWTVQGIGIYLSVLEDGAEVVQVRSRYRGLSPDPADDMVLELAINGRADAIVTNNLRHLREPARRFGIRVLLPGEFLEWMREGDDDASKS